MRRKIGRQVSIASGLVVAALLTASFASAHGNDQADAKVTLGRTHVLIHYGRPELKGRDPLKLLEPGQFWQLGADVPTTLETDGGLDFGGTRVEKGKYVLLARLVEPGRWMLVVSRKPVDSYEPSAKVAEIPLSLERDLPSAEEVTIGLSGHGTNANIEIRWGTLGLTGSFRAVR